MTSQMGRPKLENPKTSRFSVCLDANTEKRLQMYCKTHRITKGEAVRRAILLLLSQK